jgi:hypothetical protein
MLWTYNRAGLQTSYEVCQAADGLGYELKRKYEDGREEFERFNTIEQLNHRIAKIEQELLVDGWSLAGTARR